MKPFTSFTLSVFLTVAVASLIKVQDKKPAPKIKAESKTAKLSDLSIKEVSDIKKNERVPAKIRPYRSYKKKIFALGACQDSFGRIFYHDDQGFEECHNDEIPYHKNDGPFKKRKLMGLGIIL